MRRILAALLTLFLLTASPTPARADHGAAHSLGEAIGLIFLFALDTLASIGGTVTTIGSSVQLGRDPPARGWSIASIVVGTLAGLAGAITTAALVGAEVDDDTPTFWVFAVVPYVLCATNLTIGVVNLTRWKPKPPRDQEEYEYQETEEDEWSKGPSPGVGVTFAF